MGSWGFGLPLVSALHGTRLHGRLGLWVRRSNIRGRGVALSPHSSFAPSSSTSVPIPPSKLIRHDAQVGHVRAATVLLLFFTTMVGCLSHDSLSMTGLAVHRRLKLDTARVNTLLSIFSLTCKVTRLPYNPLLSHGNPHLVLKLKVFF